MAPLRNFYNLRRFFWRQRRLLRPVCLSSYRRVVVLRRAESRKLREVLHGESRAKLSEKLYFHRLYFVVVVAEYDILLFHLEYPHKDKGLWMKTDIFMLRKWQYLILSDFQVISSWDCCRELGWLSQLQGMRAESLKSGLWEQCGDQGPGPSCSPRSGPGQAAVDTGGANHRRSMSLRDSENIGNFEMNIMHNTAKRK